MLRWPYLEGLRMDEAMHPLTILAVGLYGEVLPKQNGAPMRLVVAVEVRLQGRQSRSCGSASSRSSRSTRWQESAPSEYGFYSNVNPNVDHPRWSQASERRIGEFFKNARR